MCQCMCVYMFWGVTHTQSEGRYPLSTGGTGEGGEETG